MTLGDSWDHTACCGPHASVEQHPCICGYCLVHAWRNPVFRQSVLRNGQTQLNAFRTYVAVAACSPVIKEQAHSRFQLLSHFQSVGLFWSSLGPITPNWSRFFKKKKKLQTEAHENPSLNIRYPIFRVDYSLTMGGFGFSSMLSLPCLKLTG